MREQEAPFCIQVELSLGCNLGCSFCGINGIGFEKSRAGFKFMTPEVAEAVAMNISRSGWNPRIEFARRGEPSLNPDMNEIIAIFRKWLPRTSMLMLTNGGGLLPRPLEKIEALFDAGLNTLAVENYAGIKLHDKIMRKVKAEAEVKEDGSFTFLGANGYVYPHDKRGNPHKRRRPNQRVFVSVDDIEESNTGTHSDINNHGGYGGELRSYDKPCAKPFRELSVNYDGRVNYCCIAWAGEGVCGDLTKEDITDVWNGERFDAVRRKLYRGERDFMTCLGCDHPSTRVGLLPDKKGKEEMPAPDETTVRIISEMEQEGYAVKPTDTYLERKRRFKEEQS